MAQYTDGWHKRCMCIAYAGTEMDMILRSTSLRQHLEQD